MATETTGLARLDGFADHTTVGPATAARIVCEERADLREIDVQLYLADRFGDHITQSTIRRFCKMPRGRLPKSLQGYAAAPCGGYWKRH